MGLIVQLLLGMFFAAILAVPAVATFHWWGFGADSIVFGPVAAFIVGLVFANRLYWRHVRKRAYFR